jgi:germination protein M
MLVPVTRLATIESKRVATAALRELAAGPQGNLQRLVPPDITILDIHRDEQTITVNFDRHPGSDLSLRSIALTLTEFAGVTEVRLQVQGTDLELDGQRGVFRRPVLNMDNPQGLPTDYTSGTRFLPLYFLQGSYYVRITRLVPRTTEVAEATVRELLAGPGSYRGHLFSPIPDGTQLIEVEKSENRSVVVNLTQAFVSAENREAALKVLALSLTELRDTSGRRIFTRVRVLVEGQRLAEFWGPEYDRLVERPSLNPQ